MNILITGGGTEVDIDSVRSIKNFSKGTTASLIVKKFLELDHKVTYIVSNEGKTPFQLNMNFGSSYLDENAKYSSFLENHLNWCRKYRSQYIECKYRTYDEYFDLVKQSKHQEKYDVIILAAAVSDFGMNKEEGKNSNISHLQLKPLEKVISKIKKIFPDSLLIGFKLLYNVSEVELAIESYKSIHNNGCSMVFANDYKNVGKEMFCFHDNLKVTDSITQNKKVEDFIVDEILKRKK